MSGNTSATGGYVLDVPPPPASGEQITAALQITIATLTGLPGNLVRPRWQPMPPSQPPAEVTWASVGIQRIEADDYPYLRHDGAARLPWASGAGVDHMQRHTTITVLVTFYGPEVDILAGALRDALYVQQNWEMLHKFGLKPYDIQDLARAPELVNQQWIDRMDVSLRLRRQVDRTYPILNLEGANVISHRDKGDGTIENTTVIVRPTPVITPHD